MPKTALVRTLFIPVGCSLALACGGEPVDDAPDNDTTARAIINGFAPDAAWHDATVSIHGTAFKKGQLSVSKSPFCSGTLIAADVVLTAGHCLSGRSPGNTFVSFHDDPIDAGAAFTPLAASQLQVHPQYNGGQLTDDVALIRLAQPVTGVTPVSPAPAGSLTDGSLASDATGRVQANFAGFGYSILTYGRHGRVTKSGLGELLQFDDVIEGVGCHITGCPNVNDSSIDATQLAYTQGDGGACNGDSGGPAFVFEGNPNAPSAVYVAGITSYGDANCNVYGVSTRVDAYTNNFIANFIGP